MATASTAINSAVNVRQADVLRICFKEAKYEFLKSLRNPMYSVSTLLFPIMFYVLFGLVMGKQMSEGIRTKVYVLPTYGTLGGMGASLFGTAATLASERGLGWLQVKRASPMPPFAYFLAKVVMSLIFSAIVIILLFLLGIAFGGVHLPASTLAKLGLTLIAGSLPFCAMGLAIGYFAGPTSPPSVINIFLLPMPFCSGLWLPFMFLPTFIQHIPVVLPSYHLAQLALIRAGAGQGAPCLGHWEALAGFTMLCLGVARWGHQRDGRANG